MATSKTITPTNVTVQIPAMGDQPDASVFSNCIDKAIDGINEVGGAVNLGTLSTLAALESALDSLGSSIGIRQSRTVWVQFSANASPFNSTGYGGTFYKVFDSRYRVVFWMNANNYTIEGAKTASGWVWESLSTKSDTDSVGGAGQMKAIASGTDLDTLTDPGFYGCSTGSVASSLSHCPTAANFSMVTMLKQSSLQTQVIVNDKMWIRNRTGSGWGSWQEIEQHSRTQLTITRTENNYASATEVARCTAHKCGKTLLFIFNCSLSGANMSDFVEIGSISGWSASNDVFQTIMPQSGESKPVIVQITAAGKIKIYGAQGTAYSFYRGTITAPEY